MPEIKLNPNFKIEVNNFDDYRGNILQNFGIRLNRANGIDSRRGEIGCGTKMFPHSTTVDSGLSGLTTPQTFIFSNADSGNNRYWMGDTSKLYKTASAATTKFAADALANTPTSVNGSLAVFGKPAGVDNLICPTSTDLWKLNSSWTANWWTGAGNLNQPALTSNLHDLLFYPNPFLLMVPDGNKVHTIDQSNIVINSRLQLPTNFTIVWARYANGLAYFGVSTADKTSGGVWEYDPVNEIATFYPYGIGGGDAGVPYVRYNLLFVVTSDGRINQFTGSGFQVYMETPASKCGQPFNIHRNGIVVEGQVLYFLSGGQSTFFPAGVYSLDLVDGNLYHRLPICSGNSDAGQQTSTSAGALWSDGQFLLGGMALSAKTGVFMNLNVFSADVASRNWLVTPKIPAASIKDATDALWAYFSLFSSESLDFKCRTKDLVNGYAAAGVTGTWTSTTVFTMATSSLGDVEEGDEVTIQSGTNAGLMAHISSLVSAGGTTTVTLDEAIGLGSGTSTLQFLNFRKMTSITDNDLQSEETSLPFANQTYEWVQFKIVIRGTVSVLKSVGLGKKELLRIL